MERSDLLLFAALGIAILAFMFSMTNSVTTVQNTTIVIQNITGINKTITILDALPSTFCNITFTEGIATSTTC